MACLVAAVGAGCGATGAQSDLSTGHGHVNRLDPKLLVLSPSDVGAGYALNGPATHPIPLQQTSRRLGGGCDASTWPVTPLDTLARLPTNGRLVSGVWPRCTRRIWVAGTRQRPSVTATTIRADIFQRLRMRRAYRLELAVKPRANLVGYTFKMVVYAWVEGRVSSAVTVSGRPGDSTKHLVAAAIRLARIQDTKIRMAS